jgi:hypothetical protein
MKSDSHGSYVIGATAVFVLSLLWLSWIVLRRFSITFDEGIFVDGSRRILSGQVPYRDFFIVMGPGAFWLQALALRVFGITLAASRAVMLLDLAILATCVFWLVSRQLSVAYAAWTAALLLILETANQGIMIPSHRWDSAALSVLAITICASEPRRWAIFAAGCAAAFAAWTTPPIALVGFVILIWLWCEDRLKVLPYLAGSATVSIACATALAIQGGLLPMARQLLWNGSNYMGANFLPYGSLFGRGYTQFFSGATVYELPIRALVMFGFIVPILLPPLAVLCFLKWRRSPFLQLLFLGGAALAASTYPRMDLPHLTYVAPLFYALLAILAASIPWPKLRVGVFALGTLLLTVFAWSAIAQHSRETVLETGVGAIRVAREDLAFVRDLEREIPQGSSLFVFPYLPIASFLTLSQNPTRYSYLQPGMMTAGDEATALAELRQNPPARILYFNLSERELLEIWPASDASHLRFRGLEKYLASNYHKVSSLPTAKRTFDILELKARTVATLPAPPASVRSDRGSR